MQLLLNSIFIESDLHVLYLAALMRSQAFTMEGIWMNRDFKNTFLLLVVMMTIPAVSFAQGITRASGFGFKGGFWKTAKSETLFRFDNSKIELSGVGAWLYHFSRVGPEWFYELHIGAFASIVSNEIEDEQGQETISEADITTIIPFLAGVRYDVLSARNYGGLQPYLSGGVGPYWITDVEAPSINSDKADVIDSRVKLGAYLGGGVNLAFTNWLALNFDLKRHFVGFQPQNDVSGLNLGVGLSFMWGQERETIRVISVQTISNDIYPAYHQFYTHFPIAIVTVKNMTRGNIEVNVRSNIRSFSERTKESGFIRLRARETKDIPVTVIFGARIRNLEKREAAILDLQVDARAGKKVTRKISSPLMIHRLNSWNGEVDKLIFFVKSDDETILSFSREILSAMNVNHENSTRNVDVAKGLFDAVQKKGVRYYSDPLIPFYQDDRVQLATETLRLGSGDCDDLVVLYASLLESVGINTAFVEVKDPEKTLAHLYLMFDTGLSPEQSLQISTNHKRFIMRQNLAGKQTTWIPIEATQLPNGFQEAWDVGALSYLQDGKLRGGLEAGWVQIFDVE